MRSMLTVGVIGLAALGLAGSAAPGNGAPRWLTDYAEAKAEAKRTGKPIFLVFR